MSIGEHIKMARKNKGLTQKELGNLLGISQSAVGQFENDTSNPKYETLQKIADALDVSVYSLIDINKSQKELEILQKELRDIQDNTDMPYNTKLDIMQSKENDIEQQHKILHIKQDIYKQSMKKDAETSLFAKYKKVIEKVDPLNQEGQQKVIDYAADLAGNPKYTQHNSNPDNKE